MIHIDENHHIESIGFCWASKLFDLCFALQLGQANCGCPLGISGVITQCSSICGSNRFNGNHVIHKNTVTYISVIDRNLGLSMKSPFIPIFSAISKGAICAAQGAIDLPSPVMCLGGGVMRKTDIERSCWDTDGHRKSWQLPNNCCSNVVEVQRVKTCDRSKLFCSSVDGFQWSIGDIIGG